MSKGLENFSSAAIAKPPAITAADIGFLSAAPAAKKPELAAVSPSGDMAIPNIFDKAGAAKPPEIPASVQQAIKDGKNVSFTKMSDDPDYIMNDKGQIVPNPNPNHKPSADGSIKIGVQNQELQGKNLQDKSLIDAIKQNNANQKAAADEMIRLFQQSHPKSQVPDWMKQLANVQTPLPETANSPTMPQYQPPESGSPGSSPSGPAGAPPENGFRQNCPPSGDPGGGFRNNGGFDNQGYFKGNGSEGDGQIWSGNRGNAGSAGHMGEGELVKAKDVYDYLKVHQFSNGLVMNDASCSGILGNIQQECNFNTGDINRGEGAVGFCQWEGSRRPDLMRFADNFPNYLADEARFKSHLDSHLSDQQKSDIYKQVKDDVAHTQATGHPMWTNKYVQLEFMYHEMEVGHQQAMNSHSRSAQNYDTLGHLTTSQSRGGGPSEAAHIFQHDFEKSAMWNLQPRMDKAEAMHARIARGDFHKDDTTPVAQDNTHKKTTANG